MQALDGVEQDEAAGGCPEVDDQDAEALSTEEAPSVTVQGTIGCGQESRQQCAQYAADTMYAGSTHRVVDVEHVINKLDGENQYNAAEKSDDDCPEWRHEVAAGGDAHQSCQHTVERQ